METRRAGEEDGPMGVVTSRCIFVPHVIPTAEGSLNNKVDGQMSKLLPLATPCLCNGPVNGVAKVAEVLGMPTKMGSLLSRFI